MKRLLALVPVVMLAFACAEAPDPKKATPPTEKTVVVADAKDKDKVPVRKPDPVETAKEPSKNIFQFFRIMASAVNDGGAADT